MKKKLALACTLIHRPNILLLDEPTTGVDPISRREFWEILSELNLQGTTILVSTPYMDEADRCQRVGLMYEGGLVICDRPAAIRQSVPGEVIELRPGNWRAAKEILQALPGVLQIQTYGQSLQVFVDSAQERTDEIRGVLAQAGQEFSGLHVTQPQMEQAFISLIHRLDKGEEL
jgi:ABC-2 type transport system ATP-binding protein